MNLHTSPESDWTKLEQQTIDTRELSVRELQALIISAVQVKGEWVILSQYRDMTWRLEGFPSNVPDGTREIDFALLPPDYIPIMKAIMYRYIRRGLNGGKRPSASTIRNLFLNSLPFLRNLQGCDIHDFREITPEVCANYIRDCRSIRQSRRNKGKPLSAASLERRFLAVEAIYHLSQYSNEPIPENPWPDTSARGLAGRNRKELAGKTPLLPDDVFCILFEKASSQVQRGPALLDMYDDLEKISAEHLSKNPHQLVDVKNRRLVTSGWSYGLGAFYQAVQNLRTASYVVIASTSGCRNHELANLKSGSHHMSEDDDGTVYHWLRSKSEKADTGVHDWMIPESTVSAISLMERWATPLQKLIVEEVDRRSCHNPLDPQIAEALKHSKALFLGISSNNGLVRTLSGSSWNTCLKAFATNCSIDWNLSSHQFRRKFANYAAHSQFGDLRYLREHFAHWSMDMTLGYAMDKDWGQHLDTELYEDILFELADIKSGVVGSWLQNSPLGGGYGASIKRWRRDPKNLAIFKTHASMIKSIAESTSIRSNGHSWCTADDDRCIGNTMEKTRCGGCDNSVIGIQHTGVYQRLYQNLKELLNSTDIGEGAHQRVLRDLNRCRDVLAQLGFDPEMR